MITIIRDLAITVACLTWTYANITSVAALQNMQEIFQGLIGS